MNHNIGDLLFSISHSSLAMIVETDCNILDGFTNFDYYKVKHVDDNKTYFYTIEMIEEGKRFLRLKQDEQT